jgi:hypothetical protein
MIWLIILIIILLGVIGYTGYRIWFLAGKLADSQEYIEELELTNEYMYGKIIDSLIAMQDIDQKGAFEKDDEAGTSFALLKEVIENLKNTFDGQSEEKI